MSAVDKKIVRGWVKRRSALSRKSAMPVVAWGLIFVVLGVGQAWLVATLLAGFLLGQQTPGGRPIIMLALVMIARAVCQYMQECAAARSSVAGRRLLRRDMLEAIIRVGPPLLRSQHSGAVGTLIVDRVEWLDGFFSRWIPASMIAMAGPCLVLGGLAFLNPHAAIVLAICGFMVPVAQAVFGIGAALATRRQVLAMTRLQARFLDRFRGIATIVLSNATEREASALADATDNLRRRTMRVLRVAFLSSAAIDAAMVVAILVIALMQGRALYGASTPLSTARVLVALLLIPEFFAPLRGLALAYQDRAHASGAGEAMEALARDADVATSAEIPALSGLSVNVRDISYAWDAARGPIFDHLSFDAVPGDVLVVDGRSGAGKSTLIELLMGFVRPQQGHILFNGTDIAEVSSCDIAERLTWIGQRPVIFAGSLRENILFSRPSATDAELAAAVRAAAIDTFVDDFPEGLDTVVGEGGFGLSGGQAQRVAIARAFLKDAPLLLLDEPTAHLDPATERAIIAALQELVKGRTVVLCSHSEAVRDLGTKRLILPTRKDLLESVA